MRRTHAHVFIARTRSTKEIAGELIATITLALFAVIIFMLALIGSAGTAHAQLTIFNVPSSDVLDKGKVYGELDVTFKPNDDDDNIVGRFSSFVPRVVVGTGGRVEIGLNITGNIQPGCVEIGAVKV